MRTDGMLPYEYVEDCSTTEVTGHAGLLPYIDLACVHGLLSEVDARVGVCGEQGWMDRHHILSLILLNLAGGECVEDIRMLESDAGLCRVFRAAELYGLGRGARRQMKRRFRKGRTRTFPSPTRIYEYLDEFHNECEEAKRVEGSALIPAKNEQLQGLVQVNTALLGSVQRHARCREARLDIDAALAQTTKREALYCYEGYRAYQPVTSYWAQTGMVVASEFRDGNVPAGHDMLRIVRESLAAMRLLALPGPLKPKRMKAIRFALIDVPGRVVEHARRLMVRLSRGHPALEWLLEIRRLIRTLALSSRQVLSPV